MGDGRYYTPEQFFSIIFFTVLIVFVVVAFMFSLYKVEEHKKHISITGVFLLLALFFAFIFEIAYSNMAINISYYLSSILIFVYLISNIIFLFRNKYDKNLMILALVFLIIPTLIVLKSQQVPNIIYGLYACHFIIISNIFTKYKVSSNVFADVKTLMLDYVFIISSKGDVIFENDNVSKSEIFQKIKKIDVEDIDKVFLDKIKIRNAFDKQFIKIEGEEICYLRYQKKEIIHKDKIAGYIITFIDITQLIDMLDNLSYKQNETKKVIGELVKYKEIVYDIEKEKEINNLLDEIAENQQNSMIKLKEKIEKLNVDDEDFEEQCSQIVVTAKSDLKSVRAKVNVYMNYYDKYEI